jgi:hypothetical protein
MSGMWNGVTAEPLRAAEHARILQHKKLLPPMIGSGVRRGKAALSSGCPPSRPARWDSRSACGL